MKLNNRGWGLGFLIVIGALFLLILIFVSMRIRSMTHQLKDDKKTDNSSENSKINKDIYVALEERLKKAGETYTIYHPSLIDNTNDHLIVWFDTLKSEGLIESLADPSGNGNCSGYVFIKTDDSVQSFIKCEDYKTLNYDLWED